MKRKALGTKSKPTKVKKAKVSPEEELGLTGDEDAAQLYTLYIKARMGSSEKLISKFKALWAKQYYAEKGNGKKK